jgi:Fic family protein
MAWIHEQPDWPHFRWDDAALAVRLADIRHRQGRFLGRMDALGFQLKREACLVTLTQDVVKSAAIEGEKLPSDEVRSSVARRLGIEMAGLVTASRHVDGIVDMMLDATQNFHKPLTASRLFDWHAALFPTGRSGMSKITVGAWRPEAVGPMQVVSGALGHEKVHFEAPSAARLATEMAAFLVWFNDHQPIDPFIKAGIAHFWFVTIHPFEDGNGRIARAIADMALSRADGSADRFYSMSAQIERERKAYYTALEMQQRDSVDVTAWLEWFLDCLHHAIRQAEDTLSSVLAKARIWERLNLHPVNERQRLVLNRLMDDFKGPLTTAKYVLLAKCSPDTALRDIQALMEHGILVQLPGGGRSTSYRLVTGEELAR